MNFTRSKITTMILAVIIALISVGLLLFILATPPPPLDDLVSQLFVNHLLFESLIGLIVAVSLIIAFASYFKHSKVAAQIQISISIFCVVLSTYRFMLISLLQNKLTTYIHTQDILFNSTRLVTMHNFNTASQMLLVFLRAGSIIAWVISSVMFAASIWLLLDGGLSYIKAKKLPHSFHEQISEEI